MIFSIIGVSSIFCTCYYNYTTLIKYAIDDNYNLKGNTTSNANKSNCIKNVVIYIYNWCGMFKLNFSNITFGILVYVEHCVEEYIAYFKIVCHNIIKVAARLINNICT